MNKSLKINIPEGYEIDEEKSTFAEIIFKPINSLETWEECVKSLENKGNLFYFITNNSDTEPLDAPTLNSKNYNLLPSRESAEKFLILQKLYTCRQAYIGDWKPDYSNNGMSKYSIANISNNVEIHAYLGAVRMFSFPTRELAEKFFENFKVDLEFIKEFNSSDNTDSNNKVQFPIWIWIV